MRLTKAVIPVAGKGTRFLPATKEIPKEMIPLIDRPMIHFVVEEACKAGIEEIIFITSSGKGAIEDYFDRNHGLELFLEEKNKEAELKIIRDVASMIKITSVRQKEQLGLGHAILQAEELIGDSNFAVLLGDDIIFSNKPVIGQLLEVSKNNKNASVIGVMEVDPKETKKYGIVSGNYIDKNKTLKMDKMVEKPEPHLAPSNLATPGRYILSKNIFKFLREIPRGVGGEYQLTDAINLMAQNEEVLAHIFEGDRFDTGSLNGYLDATLELACRDQKINPFIIKLMNEKIKKYS